MTRGVRPVERAWRARFEEIREVVKSVSAAVPAPAHLPYQILKSKGDKGIQSDEMKSITDKACRDAARGPREEGKQRNKGRYHIFGAM